MRIRHPGLVGLSRADQKGIIEYISSIEGVAGVSMNPVVGSLLLTWDTDRISASDIENYARFFAGMIPEQAPAAKPAPRKEVAKAKAELKKTGIAVADKVASVVVPGVKAGKRARRMAHNRIMLTALGTCICGLCLRSTVHAVFGWSFAALLGYHIYQHRRVL
jgi:hypothetical protein